MPNSTAFLKYKDGYQKLFDTMEIKQNPEIGTVITRINAGRTRYEEVSTKTGVPWYFIGIVHNLECSCDFRKHLHNGDPLTARTVQVPAGRPPNGKPPFYWADSAIDALTYQKLVGIPENDWTVPFMLFTLEGYNGFGYRNKGINSPYLWAGTNHYTKGKYVSDGKYDPNAVSKQIGAAIVLSKLMNAEKPNSIPIDVKPVNEIVKAPPTGSSPVPELPKTDIPYVGMVTRTIKLIQSLFKRKA